MKKLVLMYWIGCLSNMLNGQGIDSVKIGSSPRFGPENYIVAEDFLLEGRIGKYPVVMELNRHDTICEITYFYQQQKKDIILGGNFDSSGKVNAVLLYYRKENEYRDEFRLKRTKAGFCGIWTDGKKTLPVVLHGTKVERWKNPYRHLKSVKHWLECNPFLYIKLAGLQFIRDSVSVNGPAVLDWYREKYSGVVMPRIRSGYPPAVLQKINQQLLEIHVNNSEATLSCTDVTNDNWRWDSKVEHIFSHKSVFSITLYDEYYCGGAHGDWGWKGLNFDGKTGDLLEFDKLFWFSKTRPPSEEKNIEEFEEYRRDTVAIIIMEWLRQLYPKHMEDGDGCDYDMPEMWTRFSWYFKPAGIYIGSAGSRGCQEPEWSVIPYKLISHYLNPINKFKLPAGR